MLHVEALSNTGAFYMYQLANIVTRHSLSLSYKQIGSTVFIMKIF